MDKKYTLNGEVFTVLTVTLPGEYPIVGHTPIGELYRFPINGVNIFRGVKLVEISPYADFVIDEPVMVRDMDGFEWRQGYFAGINQDGFALKWIDGSTKWSSGGECVSWLQCRRPTAEELAT